MVLTDHNHIYTFNMNSFFLGGNRGYPLVESLLIVKSRVLRVKLWEHNKRLQCAATPCDIQNMGLPAVWCSAVGLLHSRGRAVNTATCRHEPQL